MALRANRLEGGSSHSGTATHALGRSHTSLRLAKTYNWGDPTRPTSPIAWRDVKTRDLSEAS